MGIEENEALVRKVINETNKGNYDIIDECFADDFIRTRPGSKVDRDGFKQFLLIMYKGFPDTERTIVDLIVTEDRAAIYFTWTGTHTGEFMGFPATGKKIRVKEVYFMRFKDGKISEYRQFGDTNSMRQQLGAEPPPEDSYWELD